MVCWYRITNIQFRPMAFAGHGRRRSENPSFPRNSFLGVFVVVLIRDPSLHTLPISTDPLEDSDTIMFQVPVISKENL